VVAAVNSGYRDTENKTKILEGDVADMKNLKDNGDIASRKMSLSGGTLCVD
jgi:hypothetical protein